MAGKRKKHDEQLDEQAVQDAAYSTSGDGDNFDTVMMVDEDSGDAVVMDMRSGAAAYLPADGTDSNDREPPAAGEYETMVMMDSTSGDTAIVDMQSGAGVLVTGEEMAEALYDALTSDEASPGEEPLLRASDIETLVLVNDETGDTLMLDMQSGEGVFMQAGAMAQIVVADEEEVMDEDINLDFGRRELDDTDPPSWSMPAVVGWLEERLLPAKVAQHTRNFRRELLLAGRSLFDAALRSMERSDVGDYIPPDNENAGDGSNLNLPRRRPNVRNLPTKRGPQRIELDLA